MLKSGNIQMSKKYQIGRYQIDLPADHALEQYQSTWLRYDTALGYIADVVFKKYPNSSAIDIGANVGDSAALIKKYLDIPVLCIEGNPNFVSYLKQNALIIGDITIEECFVGQDDELIDLTRMSSSRGTASIINAETSEEATANTAKIQSLAAILSNHTDFINSKLLKIDTDGFDFFIINKSIDIIEKLKPVLYFEYDISFAEKGEQQGLQTIQSLFDIGYEYFLVYDNFGNYLISLSNQEYERFLDLTAYLDSSRKKSKTPSVYYFDVCAFVEDDFDLFEEVRFMELTF
jgi:FkbM family methyltransferase